MELSIYTREPKVPQRYLRTYLSDSIRNKLDTLAQDDFRAVEEKELELTDSISAYIKTQVELFSAFCDDLIKAEYERRRQKKKESEVVSKSGSGSSRRRNSSVSTAKPLKSSFFVKSNRAGGNGSGSESDNSVKKKKVMFADTAEVSFMSDDENYSDSEEEDRNEFKTRDHNLIQSETDQEIDEQQHGYVIKESPQEDNDSYAPDHSLINQVDNISFAYPSSFNENPDNLDEVEQILFSENGQNTESPEQLSEEELNFLDPVVPTTLADNAIATVVTRNASSDEKKIVNPSTTAAVSTSFSSSSSTSASSPSSSSPILSIPHNLSIRKVPINENTDKGSLLPSHENDEELFEFDETLSPGPPGGDSQLKNEQKLQEMSYVEHISNPLVSPALAASLPTTNNFIHNSSINHRPKLSTELIAEPSQESSQPITGVTEDITTNTFNKPILKNNVNEDTRNNTDSRDNASSSVASIPLPASSQLPSSVQLSAYASSLPIEINFNKVSLSSLQRFNNEYGYNDRNGSTIDEAIVGAAGQEDDEELEGLFNYTDANNIVDPGSMSFSQRLKWEKKLKK